MPQSIEIKPFVWLLHSVYASKVLHSLRVMLDLNLNGLDVEFSASLISDEKLIAAASSYCNVPISIIYIPGPF